MTDPATTTVHLIRHCDVRNPHVVLYGHLDGFPLSELGVRQAHALGVHLADAGVRTIYTSPLERARQTAEIMAGYLSGAEITVTDDLLESEFSRYLQGVKYVHIPWRRPLWLVHMAWPGVLPNDETVGTMATRVRRVVRRAVAEHPGGTAVCISHGDPIQAFWIESEHRHALAIHRLQCAKGGMLTLRYAGEHLAAKTYAPPPELAPDSVTAPALEQPRS